MLTRRSAIQPRLHVITELRDVLVDLWEALPTDTATADIRNQSVAELKLEKIKDATKGLPWVPNKVFVGEQ